MPCAIRYSPAGLEEANRPRRRNVVRRNRIPQHKQHTRPLDILQRRHGTGYLLKEGRFPNVCRGWVPRIQVPRWRRQGSPGLFTLKDSGVVLTEIFGVNDFFHEVFELVGGEPDIAQVDGVAIGVVADGFGLKVYVGAAGEGVRHHQGR
jgi:hypothetical protein